jgi:hypothetical protein
MKSGRGADAKGLSGLARHFWALDLSICVQFARICGERAWWTDLLF